MAKDKRKKLVGGYRSGDIIVVTTAFQGRRTPPPPVGDTRPYMVDVPVGAEGLVHGEAVVVNGILDIDFDLPDGFVRLETEVGHITRA